MNSGYLDAAHVAVVRGALEAEGLTGKQFDDRLERAVERVLARRAADHYLSRTQLAERLGISGKALQMRLARGSDLAAIAEKIDGREVFRQSAVEALLARGAR